MKSSERKIYALVDDEIRGPMSLWEAQCRLNDGSLPPTTFFAHEGDENWRPAKFIMGRPVTPSNWVRGDFDPSSQFLIPILVAVVVIISLVIAGQDEKAGAMFFGVCIGLVIYVFPMVLARRRKHRNFAAIAALNILGGWTFVGWLVALIWVLYKPASAVAAPSSGSDSAEAPKTGQVRAHF